MLIFTISAEKVEWKDKDKLIIQYGLILLEGVEFMRFTISGKNIDITEGLRQRVIQKLSKLDKFFADETEIQITLSVERLRHIIEATIPMKGTIIRAEEEAEDMYAAIDDVVDILERQITKHRKKLIDRHRQDAIFAESMEQSVGSDETTDDEDIKIVRSKRFALKPMDPVEACLEMDLLGHNFFVFRNGDTDEVNVVYKRKKEGTYGLIEPEI